MATRRQRIVLDTNRCRIVGDLLLPADSYRNRLSDLLNRQELDFISLTDVEITPNDGRPSQKHDFLAVGRSHVELAYELDE